MADTAEEVKRGEPETEGKREASTISFPYLDLDDAIQVTKAVNDVGGNSCEWEQLAAKLGAAAKGGGFRMRVLTAKTFGLLSYDKGTVTLSEIGMRAVDAQQEKAARADAFLSVPLYKRVYDQFKGTSLPGTVGLEGFMVSVGVAQKVKDKARQVFQRSAKQAGFFELSADRLTLPAFRGSAKPSGDEERGDDAEQSKQKKKSGNGGPPLHPFIDGLLATLPPAALSVEKTEWSLQGRQDWLQTAVGIFNLIYKSASDDKSASLSVTVVRPKESSVN